LTIKTAGRPQRKRDATPEPLTRALLASMHDVDLDLSDSARALIRNGINIDDRTAVESALSDSAGYMHDPAVFARYVDEVIKTARRLWPRAKPIRPDDNRPTETNNSSGLCCNSATAKDFPSLGAIMG
jgi:hypothetical protein